MSTTNSLEAAADVAEIRRGQPLLAGAQPVERRKHPAEAVDRADDRYQQGQADDQELRQPLRIARRPHERICDAIHDGLVSRAVAVREVATSSTTSQTSVTADPIAIAIDAEHPPG